MSYKKTIVKVSLKLTAILLLVWLTILLLYGFQSRKKSDLSLCHTLKLKSEFQARDADADYTFTDYLENESRLFEELNTKVLPRIEQETQSRLNRYNPDSPCSPAAIGHQYNQTMQWTPDEIAGGVLLLHGLTDSPYSMQYLAKMFLKKDYYVVSLRIPGHGTIPSGLTTARWADWIAAVELAAKHVSLTAGPDKPFVIAGYSNGGALATLYALNSLKNRQLPQPTKLFLFSPAIAVSKFAALAHQLQALSVIDYFEKSNWQTITPEYDPFKYNSFPLMAASQSYELSKAIQSRVESLTPTEQWKTLCPIITFQSIADSTVSVPAITTLYSKLHPGNHELILFDVNRASVLEDFLKSNPQQILNNLNNTPQLPFTLTVITNETPESLRIVKQTRPQQQPEYEKSEQLNLSWPKQVYSLAHIAILFPPNDPLYGITPDETVHCVHLGNLEMRGERGLLQIPEANLMRLRCNPFYPWMQEKIKAAIPTSSE